MCGIVGMVGSEPVMGRCLSALAALEYRGYDSFGIATCREDGIALGRAVGSVGKALAEHRLPAVPDARLGIAHTRWATHGNVQERNAHPHLSFDRQVAIVHNGVIENHARLRRALEDDGIAFASDTDTEVVAHLMARHLAACGDVLTAIQRTQAELEGEYALGIVAAIDPVTVYGTRMKSPLLAAFDGANAMLASDRLALADIGQTLTMLEDGDIIRLRIGHAEIFAADATGRLRAVDRQPMPKGKAQRTTGKGDFPHFMLKEIHETPDAVRNVLAQPAGTFGMIAPRPGRRLLLTGAGSAFFAAQIGQYLFARLAGLPAIAYAADEAPHLACLEEGDTLVAISQSGETFDTLEVCRAARAADARLVAVTNVPEATIQRLADQTIHQGSGPEICVLSTKSVISQVTVLMRLALELGRANGTLDAERHAFYHRSLARLPETLGILLERCNPTLSRTARNHGEVTDWFFIARGALYPVALESALKLKEVSYRHAEGMGAGFLKHGTISLIDEHFHTVALLPSKSADPSLFQATLSNVSEIAARGGPIIGLGPEGVHPDDLAAFKDYIPLPYHDDNLADLIVQLVAGQLLAYHLAVHLGRNIDQPRSLAKSVTVR